MGFISIFPCIYRMYFYYIWPLYPLLPSVIHSFFPMSSLYTHFFLNFLSFLSLYCESVSFIQVFSKACVRVCCQVHNHNSSGYTTGKRNSPSLINYHTHVSSQWSVDHMSPPSSPGHFSDRVLTRPVCRSCASNDSCCTCEQ